MDVCAVVVPLPGAAGAPRSPGGGPRRADVQAWAATSVSSTTRSAPVSGSTT